LDFACQTRIQDMHTIFELASNTLIENIISVWGIRSIL